MKLRLFVFLLCCIAYFTVSAQKQIDIINADQLEFFQLDGNNYRKLIGNVILQQENVTLYCNQADFKELDNSVLASGNVKLLQGDSIQLFCNVLNYWGNTKMLKAIENVMLINGKSTLYTSMLDYDLKQKIGSYIYNGKLISDSITLTSQKGYYYANTGDAYFKNNVILNHPKYILKADSFRYNVNSKMNIFIGPTTIKNDSSEIFCNNGYYELLSGEGKFYNKANVKTDGKEISADTIYYNKNSGTGKAINHITLYDSSQKLTLCAQLVLFNLLTNNIVATGNPSITTIPDKDSLFIKADTLITLQYKDSLKIDSLSKNYRVLYAISNVKFFTHDFQAIADSIYYSSQDSIFRFYKNPVLWTDSNQIEGDTIFIFQKKGGIEKLELYGNAIIGNRIDSNLYNQTQGKIIKGYFENNKLSKIDVATNASCIYYSKDSKNAYMGANKISSGKMNFSLIDGQIKRVKFFMQPDAAFYPMKGLKPKDFIFKGFTWKENQRPLRYLFSQ